MGQNVLLPNGTAMPGPYLAGNPTLKNDGTGQQRLNTSTAIQNYNGLQASAQERLAKGLAFQFNYTWSKCLTNNQGYYGRYGNSAPAQTTADVSFQVVRLQHRAGLRPVRRRYHQHLQRLSELRSAVRPRPRVSARIPNKAVNAILGDWHYDTIVSVHGGLPISMIQFGNDPTGAYFQPRPDCIAPSSATPYKNFVGGGYVWFDPTTMAIPGPGKLGNCGISTERGPGLKQIDMSLSKNFRITERQERVVPVRRHQRVQHADLRGERLCDGRIPGRRHRQVAVRRQSDLHRQHPDGRGEHFGRLAQFAIFAEVPVLRLADRSVGGASGTTPAPLVFSRTSIARHNRHPLATMPTESCLRCAGNADRRRRTAFLRRWRSFSPRQLWRCG